MATRNEPSEESAALAAVLPGFAIRLRASRTWCRASRRALAAASGVGERAIAGYENGRRKLDMNEVLRLAGTLHVDPEFLLLGTKEPDVEALAAMRLLWKLERLDAGQTHRVVHLIEGILSQLPDESVAPN